MDEREVVSLFISVMLIVKHIFGLGNVVRVEIDPSPSLRDDK